MIIESLELKNFRNYEREDFVFDSGTNIIYGDNAQGKTNILEAIYVGGTTRSHRGSRESEMIRFGQEDSHIRMQVRRNGISHRVDIHLKKNKTRGAAVDGVPIRRAVDLFGLVHLVLFSPEDMNIIKNGPGERRRFIDSEICQLDKIYLSDLLSYNKALTQRNKLLKEIYYRPSLEDTLEIWDDQVFTYGIRLIKGREAFISRLNRMVGEIHRDLTDGKEDIEVVYDPDVTENTYRDQLLSKRERDKKMGTSTVGPHRDDIKVILNGVDIRNFGSQGQQRSAALSLKLSEIYLIREAVHDMPVLLLDDVLSELDRKRQKKILHTIQDIQTFITCTGMDELVENQFPMNKVFHIIQGKLDRES